MLSDAVAAPSVTVSVYFTEKHLLNETVLFTAHLGCPGTR